MPTKTLLLLRHAKSAWGDQSQDDHDRPLNQRGEGAADAMGALLAASAPIDLVLCSSSLRTRQTLDRIRGRLPTPPPVKIEPDLYLASGETLLGAVHSVADEVASLLVVAHSPGVHQLAFDLVGSGDTAGRARLQATYPTGALAELSVDAGSWYEVAARSMELVRFVAPRDLG